MTEGKQWPAGARIKIFLFPNEGESLDGKIYEIVPASVSSVPHVHLSWVEKGIRQTADFPSGYQLRLELGTRTNGSISGQVNLRVPTVPESVVQGVFSADVK